MLVDTNDLLHDLDIGQVTEEYESLIKTLLEIGSEVVMLTILYHQYQN